MFLYEYLSFAKIFPYIEEYVSQLNGLGEKLDKILRDEKGSRTCGAAIEHRLVDGNIDVVGQKEIAWYIYYSNKDKWDAMNSFIGNNDNALVDFTETKNTKYGKTGSVGNSGNDSYTDTNKIAGFDSTEFVNKDNTVHETKYGKKVESQDGGQDVVTVERVNRQKEKLVADKMNFWNKYGFVNMLINDCCNCITLPLYDSDLVD